jgi:hypothetical protein
MDKKENWGTLFLRSILALIRIQKADFYHKSLNIRKRLVARKKSINSLKIS